MKRIVLHESGIASGALILVNRSFPLVWVREKPVLAAVGCSRKKVLMQYEAARQYLKLRHSVKQGARILTASGWRGKKEQERIYQSSAADNGLAFTERFVALPGHSEHHTGLALDVAVGQDQLDAVCPAFAETAAGAQFAANAPQYGFILRYPEGKETETGIGYEPWHFRYVGEPHAGMMAREGLTLETYHAFLQAHPFETGGLTVQEGTRRYRIGYLAAAGSETCLEVPEACAVSVSGDNMQGFIITALEAVG